MKAMTCKQLGGACDKVFYANSFEEIAEMSKQHAMEMFQKKDGAHLKAMNEMQVLMKQPEVMKEWFENNKRNLKHYLKSKKGRKATAPNNRMHPDSKKRRSSFLVALLFAAGDARRYGF